MKARVIKKGVVIPKALLEGVNAVEILKENGAIVVTPLTRDPILGLGSQPVEDELTDASEHHNSALR